MSLFTLGLTKFQKNLSKSWTELCDLTRKIERKLIFDSAVKHNKNSNQMRKKNLVKWIAAVEQFIWPSLAFHWLTSLSLCVLKPESLGKSQVQKCSRVSKLISAAVGLKIMIPISWWSRELFTRQKRIPAGYAEIFQPSFFLLTSNFKVHFYSQQTGLKENEHDPKVQLIINRRKIKSDKCSDKQKKKKNDVRSAPHRKSRNK